MELSSVILTTGSSVGFFRLVNAGVSKLSMPDSACRNAWKWRNISTSFVHSFITAIWAVLWWVKPNKYSFNPVPLNVDLIGNYWFRSVKFGSTVSSMGSGVLRGCTQNVLWILNFTSFDFDCSLSNVDQSWFFLYPLQVFIISLGINLNTYMMQEEADCTLKWKFTGQNVKMSLK